MKVATILPQNYLYLTQKDSYFMCLGNLIGESGMENYTNFFKSRAAAGKFVIMDNGVIEGNPRPFVELINKAKVVGASEIVVPDVFQNKDATLASIREANTLLKRCPEMDSVRRMYVPQGSTMEEWFECAEEIINKHSGINDTIGIPKVLVTMGGRDARIAAIKKLDEMYPCFKHRYVHLLGCWTTPLEITMADKASVCGEIHPIRGVDSAIPFVFARAGMKLDHDDRPDKNPINFEHSEVALPLLKHNISLWRKAANSKRWF